MSPLIAKVPGTSAPTSSTEATIARGTISHPQPNLLTRETTAASTFTKGQCVCHVLSDCFSSDLLALAVDVAGYKETNLRLPVFRQLTSDRLLESGQNRSNNSIYPNAAVLPVG